MVVVQSSTRMALVPAHHPTRPRTTPQDVVMPLFSTRAHSRHHEVSRRVRVRPGEAMSTSRVSVNTTRYSVIGDVANMSLKR